MNFFLVVVIGVVFGALDGGGIYFAPGEPYKWQIFLAATLKGGLVGILTGFSLTAVVVYLAKGGPQSGDAPYVIPSGIVFGALTGLFITIFAFKKNRPPRA